MRLDKFTERLGRLFRKASDQAHGLGQPAIELEHLILALIRRQSDGRLSGSSY